MISLLALALSCPSPCSDPRPQVDEAAALLRARATRPTDDAPTAQAALGPLPAGNLLFSMVGGDNAECVRSIPDVTGDGKDEIVVGIGESGVPNVFCLDGASSGSASVAWSLQTADGVSGGSCYGDDSIRLVSDTEGDSGPANVLLGTAWGGRTAYDLDTQAGAPAWKLDTYTTANSGWVYSLCEVGDVNGDGRPERAFGTGSNSDSVYLIDGASSGTATVRWRHAAGDAVYGVRAIRDVNGDGTDDVLAAIGDDVDTIVCLEGDSTNPGGHVLWSYTPGSPGVRGCAVLPDITGDGVDELIAVLWTTLGSAIRCRSGATGLFVWNSSAIPEYAMAVELIDDVTGDGTPEIAVASWENAVSVLSGADGTLVWKTTVGTTNGGDVWTLRRVDDVDGDGVSDVVAGSFDYHVYMMSGVDGSILWAYDTGNRVFSVDAVGDLNGDGTPEVVAGTQDTHSSTVVFVLEGDGGSLGPPSFCDAGDGALAACPCANPGAPTTGCDIAQGTGGVALDLVAQVTSPSNGATLSGSGFPPAATPTAIVLRATSLEATPVAFGDGLRCVGTPVVRLGASTASAGTSTHAFGHSAGAGAFHYQLWFRNTPASYCTPGAFNLSNGRTLSW